MGPIEFDDEQTVDAGDADADGLVRPESTADLAPGTARASITRNDTPLPFGIASAPLPFVDGRLAATPAPDLGSPDFGRTMVSTGTPAILSPAAPPATPTFAARLFPVAAPSQPALARAETLPVLSLDADRATTLLPVDAPTSREPVTPRIAQEPSPAPSRPVVTPAVVTPAVVTPAVVAPALVAPAVVTPPRGEVAIAEPGPLTDVLPVPDELARIELADEAVAILCALADAESPAFVEVLEASGATLDDFVRSLEATTARIETALASGDDVPLALFDDTYVATLEGARAPVTLERYVMLVIAQERGRPLEALVAWEYPSAALSRVQRVWQRRLFDDDALAARFDDELDRARG